ncbi:MAG: MCP four helix bundle domain-containing protein [Deltaproteobacteria bacterium]|nr:MCP four helix bundle domain-containing protein [Deltaproteobacteria bacterium]
MEKIFSSLSISNKLAAVFLFLLLMMGVGGGVGLYNARQIAKVTERLYHNSFKKAETLSSVENEFLSARHEIFLHAVIGDMASKSFLEVSVGEHRKKIDRLLLEYKGMGLSKDREEIYSRLQESMGFYWGIHAKVMALSREGHRDGALGIITMEGNKSFTESISTLGKLIKNEKDTAYDAYQESDFFARFIIGVTFAFTLAAIIVAAGLWLALIRAIVRPILAIEESAKKVGEGDLRERAPVMTDDEIGSLALQFNRMADSLENHYATLEKKVEKRTEQLKDANDELMKKKYELESANIGLQEANRMKSQFLANVSHELRTPLNSIIGFSELLEERAFGELNERQTQYIDFIHSSGEHLLQLINDILDLSKIEAGRVELAKEVFSISEVLTELLGLIRPIAHKKGIEIGIKTVPASPRLLADKAKFKQIMINLLSNAVKFNVDKGSVSVDWEIIEEPGRIDPNRYVVFKVKDTGIGIRDEDRVKLFKEFEQIDSSITREHGGTGLGLVLTKRLVEMHGGRIWFDSEPGKGSVFCVKLPQGTDEIDLPAARSEVTLTASPQASAARRGVLLAGEGADINRLLEIYLSGAAYDVEIAADGFDLLKKAAAQRPFAVVMGITIPKMDGWAALKDLKSNPHTSDIPVIIISSIDDKQHGMDLGAFDYLEKPVNREKLLNSLARLTTSIKGI